MKVRDGQKYIKMSTAANRRVQKPHTEYIRDLWDYRCTVVQLYGEYRKMLLLRGWWQLVFSKKGPRHVQLRRV